MGGVKYVAKRLILPYLSYAIATVLLMLLTEQITGGRFGHYSTSKLIGIIVQLRGSDYTIGLWFLPLLLISECMLLAIIRYVKKIQSISVIVALTMIIGLLYSKYIGKPVPWGIDAAFIAMPFIFLGMLSKQYLSNAQKISLKMSLLVALCLLTLNILFCVLNLNHADRVDMWRCEYGYPIYFLLGSITGIFFIILFAINILRPITHKLKWLSYIGRNTLHIYCAHLSILFPIVGITISVIRVFWDINEVSKFILFFIIAVCLCFMYIRLIEKLRPIKMNIFNFLFCKSTFKELNIKSK